MQHRERAPSEATLATPIAVEADVAALPIGQPTLVGVAHPPVRRRGWLVRRLLLTADLTALLMAFAAAEIVFPGVGGLNQTWEFLVFLGTLPFWIAAIKLAGLYDQDDRRTGHSTVDELPRIFSVVTGAAWAFFVASWLLGLSHIDRQKLTWFWFLAILALFTCRAAARAVARRNPAYVQRALLVGAGDVGQMMGRKILNHPEYGIQLVGFADANPKERREDLDDLLLLGSIDDVPQLIEEHDVERVLIAFSNDSDWDLLDLVRRLKDADVQVDVVPRLFEILGPGMAFTSMEGTPILSIPRLRLSRSSRLMKRTMDIVFSLAGLILVMPLLAVIAVAIKLDSRGPVLFRQLRMGQGGKPFRLLKFRTMAVDAEARKSDLAQLNKHVRRDPRMFKIPNDPRVTRVGRVLRRYSLDELPQLFNVLGGEMSLVGPRPLVLDEDAHVTAWARKRLDLLPGITGLWQVAGRDDIPFEEMITLDYAYVSGWSLGGDLKLLAKTVPAVLRSRTSY